MTRDSEDVEGLIAPQVFVVRVAGHGEHGLSILDGLLTLFIAERLCYFCWRHWRVHHIKCQFESIVEHARYQLPQQLIALLQARICIYFNKPWSHGRVHHKIVAEYLHAELSVVLVDLLAYAHQCSFNYGDHLFSIHFIEVRIYTILFLQELLAFLEG